MGVARAGDARGEDAAEVTVPYPYQSGDFCATEHPDVFFEQFQAAVARGDVADPSARAARAVRPRKPLGLGGNLPMLEAEDLFLYEDSEQLLLTNFSNDALFQLMGDASAELIDRHGDNFDFVAFWLNFPANHQIGAAFYLGLENFTEGLGLNFFNRRPSFGVPGENVEGFVMMWNVNSWSPGTGPQAAFTRLVLGQEFEHRWAMFLDPIAGGRDLQGDNGACGRSSHWSFRVDGQASGMEIAEWVGSNPAQRVGGSLGFNTDIGGVFSPTDLYLMGYLSPEEMDARNSEFRFMENSNCSSSYNGPILGLNAGRIILSNGARVPSSADAQRDFRVGWIMIHLPGDVPSSTETNRALGIMEQHQIDWFHGTLGRGTISASARAILGGDSDEDGDVDLNDFGVFAQCLSGEGNTAGAPGCNVFDDDVDGDVDLLDYGAFSRAFSGDCGVSFADQPDDALVCLGDSTVFTVDTVGATFSYQWLFDGVPIAGANGPTLTINSIGDADLGVYRVSATGECATTHSENAVLAKHDPPVVTQQPQGVAVCDAGSVEFSVEATGVAPLAYQWRLEGIAIPGATDSTLVIEDVDSGDLGLYTCAVFDGCGVSTESDTAVLRFATDVAIVLQPVGSELCEEETVSLFVVADGAASFQWFKDDAPISGATSPFLFIANAMQSDSGVYHVEATGACTADVSDDAIVTVSDCGGAP